MKPRAWAWLLVAVSLLAIVVVADFVARSMLTSAISKSVRQRSGAESVAVQVHTISALWSLLTSRFAGVDVDLVRPQRDGYTVDEVSLSLQSVRYEPASGTRPSLLSGGSGTAVVRATEDQLNAGFVRSGLPARVHLVENGVEASTELPRIGKVTATGSLDVRDGTLLVDLSKLSAAGHTIDIPAALPALRISLPAVPPDTHLQGYFVVGGRLEIRVGFGEFRVVEGQFGASGQHEPAADEQSMLAVA